jgi:FkbM family methyltransferase
MDAIEDFDSAQLLGIDLSTVERILKPKMVVVDASQGGYGWPSCVMEKGDDLTIHVFEPDYEKRREIEEELNGEVYDGKVVLHQFDVADIVPEKLRQRGGQWSIGVLFLGARPDALDVIRSLSDLYERGRIDYTIFTPTQDDLNSIVDELGRTRTEVFKLGNSNECVAVTDRFRNKMRGKTQFNSFGIAAVCEEFGIACKGVIQLGGAFGEDGPDFIAAGASRVLMIEANPELYEKICARYASDSRFVVVNCAATDKIGPVEFRLMSQPLSSSMLPLSYHKEIYPEIDEVKRLQVDGLTLDHVMQQLSEAGVSPGEFNILKMDIQGAEILAMKGGIKTLAGIDAILTEVAIKPLYEGGASLDDMDQAMNTLGFVRIATNFAEHVDWGDAFYVRAHPVSPVAVSPSPAPRPSSGIMPMAIDAPTLAAAQEKWDPMPLRVARQQLTQRLINLTTEQVGQQFKQDIWPRMKELMTSRLNLMPLLWEEFVASQQLAHSASMGQSHPKFVNCLLATMLYRPMSQITLPMDKTVLPRWLVEVE